MAVTLVNFRGALITELVARGVRVFALAPDFDDRIRSALRELGAEPIDISLDRAGMRVGRDVIDFYRLCRQLLRLSPDAVFAYFIKPVVYGSIAAWVVRVPRRFSLVAGLGYVFTEDGRPRSPKRRLLKAAALVLYRAAFAVCHCIFFQNEDDIRELIGQNRRVLSRVCRLSGSGVDLRLWTPAKPVTAPITFLLVARLLREKGIAEYVEAARQVKADHPGARFILLGNIDPNPGSFSREEVAAWVAEGTIEWPGHVDDVRPWIERSSVFVLPSYREGMPRSTQEAMAMGRPVITTDAVGCRETVIDGVTGFIVPVRSVQPLREAMLKFIKDPSTLSSMGEASRRLAEERFDVHGINARMLRAMAIDGGN